MTELEQHYKNLAEYYSLKLKDEQHTNKLKIELLEYRLLEARLLVPEEKKLCN